VTQTKKLKDEPYILKTVAVRERCQNEHKNNISAKAPWLQALMCTVLSPENFVLLGPGLNQKAKGLV
jgi:hypothetical protein